MLQRKDLYRFSAQIVAGGVLILGGAAATGAATGATGLSGLAGLFRDKRNDSLDAAIDAAVQESESALRNLRDFTDADFERATALLETAPRGIDPAAYAAAARTGPPEPQMTAGLLAAIDFQPDDDAPRRLLELVLGQTVRTICAHPAMQAAISRAFDVQNAQDNAELRALVRDLHKRSDTTVPEAALIALARKIQPRIKNREDALNELERATDIAAAVIARGEAGSNLDAFVNDVLHQLADLTTEGRFDDAATLARARLAEAKAGVASLRNAAIDAEMLAGNAAPAATLIAERVAEDTPDPAERFDALRKEQNGWYERGRDRGLRLDLEVAIALADLSVGQADTPDQRGAALNNLGIALQTLGARETGTERLEAAVEAYKAALLERTRDRVPLDWAQTQNNLGIALATLGERETGTARLEAAVEAFENALLEWTRDRVPLEWASTQNNLGNALRTLGERETGTARLEAAVEAYENALLEWTRDRVPLDWALTQNNLGNALAALGARETGTDRLEAAVEAYENALLERTRDRVPRYWAGTQNNLGNALQTLGARETGTARLEAAVEAYENALLEWTRDRVPLDWARTQNNLGNALQTLGARETGTDRLEAAVEAYENALLEWTRDRVPLDWARTQNNLGNALATLGARETGTDRLEAAVEAYENALLEWTRDRVPLDWAMSAGNQAVALRLLAERTEDLALARRARAQIAAAEAQMRAGGHVPFADYYGGQLPEADALLARLGC